MDWINFVRDWGNWRAVVNTVLSPRVLTKCWKLLDHLDFSRTAWLHGEVSDSDLVRNNVPRPISSCSRWPTSLSTARHTLFLWCHCCWSLIFGSNLCQAIKTRITLCILQQPFKPLNAELNPIRHLLALVGARHIVHVSRIRVKKRPTTTKWRTPLFSTYNLYPANLQNMLSSYQS